MNKLEVNGLSKSFGSRQILKEVSLSLETGDMFGLFGRNGSGKSTLLKCMMGTLRADALEIKFNGREISASEVISAKRIGFLPQDPFLPKEMKVRNLIPFIFPNGEDQDKIFYSPGVAAFDGKIIGTLSAGELKYLELIILANLSHPFLLLDEPFSMVEPKIIELVKDLLLSLRKTKGLLITDHYYSDVLEVANRSLLLKNSTLLEVESDDDLAAHEYLKIRKE
ncbi:ATP-binding cassette domain-containing protein [Salinimicrobium oceani]|uniref:ATP-binding cassette domain-containing protein n=1 Tax=Salinimicrobium oceani TaxID=2722702 RepID=A0ABX1CVE3_9FLAO|nr:ATP-binding cassette domain-containing protein [Salinimicrobium oceani]NJW52249.1 ATP-binding cassette domain-containing protein [Salinimicrobium oceani]